LLAIARWFLSNSSPSDERLMMILDQNMPFTHRPMHSAMWSLRRQTPRALRRQARPQVLRYLSRYTHRIAISNRRLLSADQKGVTFK